MTDSIPAHRPDQNRLLAALPAADFERFSDHLELVPLLLGDTLYEPGGPLPYVYFPTTAIVSLLYIVEHGSSAEFAAVGNEGILGISMFMGGDTPPSYAVVLVSGHAYRLQARLLKQEFDRGGPVQALLLRYAKALLTTASQTAVCNRFHSIEQQLCRWLLSVLDRSSTNELILTHELVANVLGVRREGISVAVGKLQRNGIIQSRRGHIFVLERSGLEHATCECYGVVRKELDRLLVEVPRLNKPSFVPLR